MASVATDCKIYLDGYDLSGDMNALMVRSGVDAEDATVFGSGVHVAEPGLPMHRIEYAGLWQSGTDLLDEVLQARLGVADGVLLVSPQTGAAGEVCHLLQCSQDTYRPQSEVGRLIRFDGSVVATERELVRGSILLAKASYATSDSGTGQQLGAVGATQSLYGVLQVFSGTGTLDVVVESDDNAGFTTATTRITFTQATGRTAEYATPVAGPITDDYWRITYTIATGPFTFAVGVGIQ